MYRLRLTLALSLMLALVCLQAAFVYWGTVRVDGYAHHSRLTSDLLSELLDLSANKQRLRNWAAQQVMGAGATEASRERLLDAMDAGARRLDELSRRHLASWEAIARRDDVAVPPQVTQLVDISALLADNLVELRRQLRALEPHGEREGFESVWRQLNQVFDKTHGRDLRDLLNGAIEGQRQAVPIARAATEQGIARLRLQSVVMVALTFACAVALSLHLRSRLRRPLDALLEGAQAVQAGRLGHRIPVGRGDEFDQVALRFNTMAWELQQHREAAEAVRRGLEDEVRARTGDLERAHLALQRLDHRRRQLFADLGHELRTPATVIRGEADVALRAGELPTQEYRSTLTRIVAAVKQMTGVVDDLLLIARAEANELDIARQRLPLGTLLDGAVDQAQALAAAHGQRLIVEAATDGQTVSADPIRLRQALVIVLDNAIRYSRPGGAVRITWAVDEPASDVTTGVSAARVAIQVSDDGIGIPEEELPLVFERFMRGRLAREHRADGTGIGLSIARSILAAHGGHLEIDSQVGRGTTVRLIIPDTTTP